MVEDQYDDLISLLEQRAEALKPQRDLIDSAIRRCERYQIAHGSSSNEEEVEDPTDDNEIEAVDDDQEITAASDVDEPSAEGEESSAKEASASANDTESLEAKHESEEALSVARTMQENRLTNEQLEEHREVAEKHKKKKKKKHKILPPGTEIQGYRILGLLGKGGMGQVYRALQLSMNREVAFKVLAQRYAASKSFRTRFLREAQSAGRLHHRHLIAVHDVDETPDGVLFFSMELVEGKSVGDIIDDTGPMEEAEALRITKQTLEALAYAHERNIIHRDIKPDNIIIDGEGSAKVADLGLSRIDDEENDGDGRVTAANTMMGTPYYMSPEQSRDAHHVDHRTDLYSVGATLFHMICGDVPFDGETPLDVVVSASTEKLEFFDPYPTNGTQRFIRLMMAKDPKDRPGSAAEAYELLKRLESDPKASLSSPNSTKMLVSIAIIVLILMLIIMGMMADPPPNNAEGEHDGTHHQETDGENPGSVAAATKPLNLFESFYCDMGEEPIHTDNYSTFSANGQATARFDNLVEEGNPNAHFQLHLKDIDFKDQGAFIFQIKTNKNTRGVRSRMQSALVISSRGIFFGHPGPAGSGPGAERMKPGRDRDFSENVKPLGRLADNQFIDIITNGKTASISVRGNEKNSVEIEVEGGIQSINLRWQVRGTIAAQLKLL